MSVEASALLDPLFRPAPMRALFDDRARVQAMLDFEAALARVEARLGIIPESAAAPIAAACQVEQLDLSALAQETARAGNPAIPLVRALTALVAERDAEAAKYVHWGATSQDVIDTGTVLQVRRALELLDAQLARLGAALAQLADAHRRTPMAGRTFLQHAVPVTLGLKAAGWLSALTRDRARIAALRGRALCLQLGGAAGTLSALGPGERGIALSEALAAELALTLPELPWHTQRDRIAEVGTVLGLAIGALGKLARDVSLLMQTELGEVREPAGPGRGGSSSMPQKRNPLACTVALAAATRAPGLVATLLSAMVQEHERGIGGWHAEWETLPALFCSASGSLEAMREAIEGLEVDAARMRAGLEASGGTIFAESIAMALADVLGKQAAHRLVAQCCRDAEDSGERLQDVLRRHLEIRAHLDRDALDQRLSVEHALGMNDALIARVLQTVARERPDEEPT